MGPITAVAGVGDKGPGQLREEGPGGGGEAGVTQGWECYVPHRHTGLSSPLPS